MEWSDVFVEEGKREGREEGKKISTVEGWLNGWLDVLRFERKEERSPLCDY